MKSYIPFDIRSIGFEMTGSVMTGSDTKMPIKVRNVIVEDYSQGFPDEGFKDVSFN